MKKSIVFALLLMLVLTACATNRKPATDNTPTPESWETFQEENTTKESFSVEYSNLNDEEERTQVDALMEKAGISEERRSQLWDHVRQFNEAVDSSLLLPKLTLADVLNPAYDSYDYQDQWAEKYPDFNGYNCRITAFSLFSSQVRTGKGAEVRDSDLFMDLESLEQDSSALQSERELNTFRTLFSTIPTENTTDTAIHLQKVQEDWAQRGIEFDESDSLHLITVWLHNQWSEGENELFVGHVGVLMNVEDELYFIEKVAFQAPYRLIHLDSPSELYDYLMACYDTQWGQTTAKPFLMEDDQPFLP